MTIAAGFVCSDGVVLGADSELSTGWDKYRGPKIWHRTTGTKQDVREVAITGAGDYGLLKLAAEEILSRLPTADTTFTADDLRHALVEPIVERLYEDHIDKAPPDRVDAGFDVSLLIGIRGSDGMKLFETSRTATSTVGTFTCAGTGAPVARYIADSLYHADANTWWACQLAAYLLHQTKRYGADCGGDSSILFMTDDSPGVLFDQELASIFENVGKHLYGAVHEAFRSCSTPMDQSDVDKAVDVFRTAVEECLRDEE